MIAPHGDPYLVIILIWAEMGGGGGDRSPWRPAPRHHTDPGRDGGGEGEGVIAPHGDPRLVIILIRAEMGGGGGGGDRSPRRPVPRHHTDPGRDGGEGEGVIAPHGDPRLVIILIRAEMGGRGRG